ncbi:MAG: phospholipase D family protein [Lachnospiraceae bacterium]|nr:phospholipase D family protein [Lachnospiraceae bacterium]
MKRFFCLFKRILLLWLLYFFVCMVVPPLFHKPSLPNSTEESASLGAAAELQKGAFPDIAADEKAQERVRSIDDNTEALLWRLRLIETAQERVVLTTFDLRDDNSGRDVMAALFHSAQRGVKVQVLVDGMNGVLRLTGSDCFRELSSQENVEIKLYNPITLLAPWKNNYRMHDKYVIADDFAYLLGGRNTDDLFLGSYVDSYNEDRDILVYEEMPGAGNSFIQLEEYFDQIWNLPCCKTYKKMAAGPAYLEEHYQEVRKKYPQAFAGTDSGEAESGTDGGPDSDGFDWEAATLETQGVELCTNPINPGNKHPVLWDRLVEEMKQEEDILIQTPYIICDKKMYQDLTELCADGARTEIIINAVESGTNPFGCTDYLNQKKKVRGTGVQTYEYLGNQALHTKTVLAGERISIVGSCNLDMRSIYLDTEMMLRIDSRELNAQLREQAETMKDRCRSVSPEGVVTEGENYQAREQSAGKKIIYGILRAVIIPFRHLL